MIYKREELELFWTAKSPLSNFYLVKFEHKNKIFFCSEQAVMYEKALLFGSQKIANEIMKAPTAIACKKLGRSTEIDFVNEVWEKHRERIYKEVLMSKFSTKKMFNCLKLTRGKKLVEASPYDKIWGVGLDASDDRILDSSKWRGKNLLGKILEEVRSELC